MLPENCGPIYTKLILNIDKISMDKTFVLYLLYVFSYQFPQYGKVGVCCRPYEYPEENISCNHRKEKSRFTYSNRFIK